MPDSSGCNDLKVPHAIGSGVERNRRKWVLKASRRVGRSSSNGQVNHQDEHISEIEYLEKTEKKTSVNIMPRRKLGTKYQ